MPRIFPREEAAKLLRKTAWESLLRFNPPYPNVFRVLKDDYEYAVEHLNDSEASNGGDSPAEHLSRHVMIAYAHNWVDTAVLDRLFELASPALRTFAIGDAGRDLDNTPGPVGTSGVWCPTRSAISCASCRAFLRGGESSLAGALRPPCWWRSGSFLRISGRTRPTQISGGSGRVSARARLIGRRSPIRGQAQRSRGTRRRTGRRQARAVDGRRGAAGGVPWLQLVLRHARPCRSRLTCLKLGGQCLSDPRFVRPRIAVLLSLQGVDWIDPRCAAGRSVGCQQHQTQQPSGDCEQRQRVDRVDSVEKRSKKPRSRQTDGKTHGDPGHG